MFSQNAGPRRLRELFERPGPILSLGVHDVFSALVAERAGLEMLFIGGFGTTASLLGLPDLDFLTVGEMADAVRRTARRVTVPVVADGDTGHGDLHHVARTVSEFEGAGASGIILEDQVAPKRCGHFEGKAVISAEEMERKLKAALRARQNPDFLLIARTDARETLGLAEAIARANRYGDAGADCVFVEAPLSPEELERIPQEVRYPLLANMLTGGKTPILPAGELVRLGYKIIVCPIESLLMTAATVRRLAETLLQKGCVDSLTGEMISFAEVKELLGVEAFLKLREEG
ncbi:MAG: isocitrate lyase/PEP mutase family protein [Armatimonadetes bacterium]|nr:isocitrate lyase/PEP mutase family protein [Armatimonadota bacterium]